MSIAAPPSGPPNVVSGSGVISGNAYAQQQQQQQAQQQQEDQQRAQQARLAQMRQEQPQARPYSREVFFNPKSGHTEFVRDPYGRLNKDYADLTSPPDTSKADFTLFKEVSASAAAKGETVTTLSTVRDYSTGQLKGGSYSYLEPVRQTVQPATPAQLIAAPSIPKPVPVVSTSEFNALIASNSRGSNGQSIGEGYAPKTPTYDAPADFGYASAVPGSKGTAFTFEDNTRGLGGRTTVIVPHVTPTSPQVAAAKSVPISEQPIGLSKDPFQAFAAPFENFARPFITAFEILPATPKILFGSAQDKLDAQSTVYNAFIEQQKAYKPDVEGAAFQRLVIPELESHFNNVKTTYTQTPLSGAPTVRTGSTFTDNAQQFGDRLAKEPPQSVAASLLASAILAAPDIVFKGISAASKIVRAAPEVAAHISALKNLNLKEPTPEVTRVLDKSPITYGQKASLPEEVRQYRIEKYGSENLPFADYESLRSAKEYGPIFQAARGNPSPIQPAITKPFEVESDLLQRGESLGSSIVRKPEPVNTPQLKTEAIPVSSAGKFAALGVEPKGSSGYVRIEGAGGRNIFIPKAPLKGEIPESLLAPSAKGESINPLQPVEKLDIRNPYQGSPSVFGALGVEPKGTNAYIRIRGRNRNIFIPKGGKGEVPESLLAPSAKLFPEPLEKEPLRFASIKPVFGALNVEPKGIGSHVGIELPGGKRLNIPKLPTGEVPESRLAAGKSPIGGFIQREPLAKPQPASSSSIFGALSTEPKGIGSSIGIRLPSGKRLNIPKFPTGEVPESKLAAGKPPFPAPKAEKPIEQLSISEITSRIESVAKLEASEGAFGKQSYRNELERLISLKAEREKASSTKGTTKAPRIIGASIPRGVGEALLKGVSPLATRKKKNIPTYQNENIDAGRFEETGTSQVAELVKPGTVKGQVKEEQAAKDLGISIVSGAVNPRPFGSSKTIDALKAAARQEGFYSSLTSPGQESRSSTRLVSRSGTQELLSRDTAAGVISDVSSGITASRIGTFDLIGESQLKTSQSSAFSLGLPSENVPSSNVPSFKLPSFGVPSFSDFGTPRIKPPGLGGKRRRTARDRTGKYRAIPVNYKASSLLLAYLGGGAPLAVGFEKRFQNLY